MLNFCTLFDENYLAKGLLMYQSLMKVCPNFRLFIFAFDDKTYTIFNQLKLDKITLISLREFENKELLKVKKSRTKAEYCWTCTPSIILFCLEKYNISHCIYLDADLYFFSNPQILINEIGDSDVMLTEHRYSPEYDRSAFSGKYCVQFVYFKKSTNGFEVLNWWKDSCIDWCYNKSEDGKFGDQKYLDDWNERYFGIHDMINFGGGVAPWNVQQYDLKIIDNSIFVYDKQIKISSELVFYHFHYLNNVIINGINEFNLGHYRLSRDVVKYIYKPYLKKLTFINSYLKNNKITDRSLGSKVMKYSMIRLIGHFIKNIFNKNKIVWFEPKKISEINFENFFKNNFHETKL